MMALGEILAARADNARARGTVEAGTLGTVTVEALPVRELERLMRGADGDRAVFYAACRELQGAGAALLRAGKVYRPDQVMALVSDAEAAKAAEAVRALSGWTGMDGGTAQRTDFPAENADSAGAGEAADTGASSEASDGAAGEAAAHGTDTDKKAAFPAVTSDGRTADNGRSRGQRFDYTADGTDEGAGGQDSHETDKKAEIRPAVVQVNAEVRREAVQKKTADAAFRPDTVREKAGKNAEIRHRSVHGEKAGGQASCEFLAEYGEPFPPDGKTQVLPEKSPDAPQNVGVSDKMDGSLQKTEREFLSERAAPEDGYALGLHESKSEIDGRGGANLHESESEMVREAETRCTKVSRKSRKRCTKPSRKTTRQAGIRCTKVSRKSRKRCTKPHRNLPRGSRGSCSTACAARRGCDRGEYGKESDNFDLAQQR